MNKSYLILKKTLYPLINLGTMIMLVFIKKRKKVVVIGAWEGCRYADNSRNLFEYLEKEPEYSVYWITRSDNVYRQLKNRGSNCIKCGTIKSIMTHLIAYYHITCNSHVDIDGSLSWGAKRINLWHGMPIKAVAKKANREGYSKRTFLHDTEIYKWLKSKTIMNPGGWNDCFYVSPGPNSDEMFLTDFCIPNNRIIKTNYPRNIANNSILGEEQELVDALSRYKTKILYMPTFRENDNDRRNNPIKDARMAALLKSQDAVWIDKRHLASVAQEIDSNNDYHIIHIKNTVDIYSIINYVDIIITDYSSVYYDSLYNRKKTILFMPDYKYYKNQDRGFLFDPATLECCDKAYDIEALISAVKYSMNNSWEEQESEAMETVRNKYWSYPEKEIADIWKDIVSFVE